MAVLKYEQIVDALRARITGGEFGPGDLLPSGRDLAEEWGVSRATVVKAMDVLRADGVVVARQGAGFVVAEQPLARPAGTRGPGARTTGATAYRILGAPAEEVPPADVAAALGIPDDGPALRRTRLLLLEDGTPSPSSTPGFRPPSRHGVRASPSPPRWPRAPRTTSSSAPVGRPHRART